MKDEQTRLPGTKEGTAISKLVIVCILAFVLAAILMVLNNIFDVPPVLANILSLKWARIALDVFYMLVVGVFATYLALRLVRGHTRMEEELQLRAQLLDAATDSIFVYDPDDWHFVYSNEVGYRSRGYTKEELMAMNRRDLIEPELAEVFDSRVRQIIDKGEGTFESIHLHKNGTAIPVEMHSRPIRVGGKTLILSICRDITRRKQAEEELNLKAQLLDAATDLIHVTDLDRNILYVNEAWCLSLGYSRDELLGHDIHEFMAPGYAESLTVINFEALEKGETTMGGAYVRKDKTVMPVEVHVRIISWGGKKVRLAVVRDVTRRKQAEETLRQSEEKLRLTFESMNQGFSIIDLDGKYVQVNEAKARLHGYDRKEELIGRSATDFIAEHERSQVVEGMMRDLETGIGIKEERTLLRKDGSQFAAEISTSVFRDASGKPIGIIAVSEDITERKKMQVQLMVSDRLASIGELVSGVAHELNNPLTSIIGFSELLAERKDLPQDVKEDLEVINKESHRTAQVVRNLLSFARKQKAEKLPVDLNSALETVLRLRTYEHKLNNIQVVKQLAADLPQIIANSFQLQQVFLNIIINAEFFMLEAHGKGTLTITTERVEDKVKISFANDGPGITPENLRHIFDPFFTTKEVGKGTGLGLSICHGIVTEHGGRIWAESEPGKGATFIVELPLSISERERTIP